ncbi:hypothetical protein GCM10027068_24680 [Prescottella soli]
MERAGGHTGLGGDHVGSDELDAPLLGEAGGGLTERDARRHLLPVPQTEFFTHFIEGTEFAELCNVAGERNVVESSTQKTAA